MPSPPQKSRGLDRSLLSRLFVRMLPHWKLALLALFIILIAALAETALPLVTRHAIDVDLSHGDMQGLAHTVAFYFSLALLAFVARFFQQLITGWIGQSIVLKIKDDLYKRVLSMHMSWFDKNPAGQTLSRLTNDTETLNELFTGGLILIFQDILLLILISAALLYMDWRLALVLYCVLPPIIFITFQFKRLVRVAFRKIRALVGDVSTFLQENITGMSVVQLFQREKENRRRFKKINDALMDQHIKTIFYFAVFFPLMEVMGSVATASILWAGAGRLLEHSLTFGALVAFLHYAERFFRPIRDLAEKYNILQSAMAAAERVFELLDSEPEIRSSLGAKSMANAQLSTSDKGRVTAAHKQTAPYGSRVPVGLRIEFDHVWFAYNDDNWVLRDLSFTTSVGESLAIVGATGAGKSSIFALILRQYEFQRGQILVNGRDIREWPLDELRSQMAIVLQDVHLFSSSLRDNILMGRTHCESSLDDALRRTGLLAHLDRLPNGIDSKAGERGVRLSMGQRQLVSFARALVGNPAMLLLDEATSSVDSLAEDMIQKATREVLAARSSVVIAHRLSTIQQAHRILVLHKGELCESGKHDELLAEQGIYYRLWHLEAGKEILDA
jgi:ATP-binding cassette, subfamily B, multidrug efflux pump